MDRVTLAALSLFAASLVLLGLGGFIQLDDTSGFGYERWVMPLGAVAVLVASVALGVALSRRTATLALGAASGILVAALVVLAVVDDGFRFIWGGDEGELFLLVVVLALGAAALLTPSRYVSGSADGPDGPAGPRRRSGWARAVSYACVLGVAMFAAFAAGAAHFTATQCVGAGGECDVAALEGLLWTAAVLVLGVLAIAANEVRLRKHRRRPAS